MNWIFQAITKRYDLRKELAKGVVETWLVTRFRDEMRAGDIVFLWSAGSKDIRGIYGWGRIDDNEPRFHRNWGYGRKVKYEVVLPARLPFDEIKDLPEMTDHIIFRSAVGTNFRLEEVQAKSISNLIEEKFGQEFAPHG